jgi:hypothetical protein
MAEALLAGVVLNAALSAGKKLAAKTRPLEISIKSDSVGFSISPYAYVSGKLIAIRVQDVARGIWYSWDGSTRTWDKTPVVYVGSKTLYIAAAAVNAGNVAGTLTLTITDDTGKVLGDVTTGGSKSQTVQPWNGSYTSPNDYLGYETGSIDMPNRSYGITVSVIP